MRIKGIVLTLLLVLGETAVAQSRRALIIGNDTYPGNELRNARNDATSIYEALKGVGYESTLVLDANRVTLIAKIDHFVDTLQSGDTAFVYYAGHGIQVAGENYLVPTDFKLTTPDAVAQGAYSLSSVLERLKSHGVVTQIVVLDSCRDNPFLGGRSLKGGWAVVGAPAGSFLAFGTSPGSTASDDPKGVHGLFTKNLLPWLTRPDMDIEEMFRKVREAVVRESNGEQVPWVSSSMVGEYHVPNDSDPRALSWLVKTDVRGSAVVDYSRTLKNSDVAVTKASPQDPSLADGEISRAITFAKVGQFESAISLLQHVLTMNPGSVLALRLLGLLSHKAGRDDEASSTFSRLMYYDKSDSGAAAYKCATEALANDSNLESDCKATAATNPTADSYLALAAALVLGGSDQPAYAAVNQSIALKPSDLSLALQGLIEAQQGRSEAAERNYSRASQLAVFGVPR
jgi:tetratricopeptide (TPR) repeat protein